MKRYLVLLSLFIWVSVNLFAQEYPLLGKYKNESTTLNITSTGFSMNDGNPMTLVLGQKSSSVMESVMFGKYYIKPSYVNNDSHSTLINIWLLYGENAILMLYIFDFNKATNTLSLTSYDMFTGGCSRTEYTRITEE